VGVLDDRQLWWLSGGLVLVALAGVSVFVLGVLELFAALTAGSTAGMIVSIAVPYLIGLFVLAIAGSGMVVWLVVILARHASEEFDSGRLQQVSECATESDVVRLLR